MALFNENQKRQIADAVARAEANTAGELVVVHAARSDNYAEHRASVAFIVSLATAHLGHLLQPSADMLYILVGQGVVGAFAYFLLGFGLCVRAIVSPDLRSKQVMRGAMVTFAEHGVTETRDRSGVLIYLSELEHRVVILADKGINERVEPDEWSKDVDTLVASLKSGDPTAGLLSVIDRIGSLLAEAFPRRKDDENELSNELHQT